MERNEGFPYLQLGRETRGEVVYHCAVECLPMSQVLGFCCQEKKVVD